MTIYYLITACILSFLVGLFAHARVSAFKKKLIDIDWDTVASLSSDVALLKKRIQKLQAVDNGVKHGRINELEILAQMQTKEMKNGRTEPIGSSEIRGG